jgi:hypothetical protein
VVICFDAQPGNSVPELGAGPGVMVMPNPVAGDEVIVVHEYPNGVDGLQVVLCDALGARALVRPVPPGEARTRIATSGLASGLWFVVLERNGLERSTSRLVIAR